MSDIDPDASPPTPTIEDLAGLRAEVAGAPAHEMATAAAGGMIVAMLLALPLGIWWGTDASAVGGMLAGLGWWLLLVVGMIGVTVVIGDGNSHRTAGLTLLIGGALAGLGWFLYYGDQGWMLPAALTVIGPLGGLVGWRGEARNQAAARADPPLGMRPETLAACMALPDPLAEPLAGLVDRAVADVNALDRFIDNGMLAASGESVVALQADVDRAMRTLARRALVADTMSRRGNREAADAVTAEVQRIADELHRLTDAALLAAASAEGGTPLDLAEHIENLRLTTAGQAELHAALDE